MSTIQQLWIVPAYTVVLATIVNNVEMTAERELDDVLSEGVFYDIYRTEEALSLYVVIGRNSGAINTARFGQFFGAVQNICFRQAILSCARIYDPPHKVYATRSLPVALKIVDTKLGALSVRQPVRLVRYLKSLGYQNVDSLSDERLARLLVDHYRPKMDGLKSSSALMRLLEARDKHIAHNERVPSATPTGPSIAEIESVLAFAKDFLAIFSSVFLSVFHQGDDGKPFITAGRSVSSARKILTALGITPNETPLD